MTGFSTTLGAGRWLDHLLALAAVSAIIALSWFYLVRMNAAMPHGPGGMARMMMPATAPGLVEQLTTAFVMWSIMMVAMMLPTALPAVTVFGGLTRRRAPHRQPALSTGMFVGGYLAVWIGYSVAAAVGQVALSQAALLTPMLQSTSRALSVAILLAAGAFQFTALKEMCVTQCRTPFAFFLAEWRDGKIGALVLGLKHGSYCVGCCWALMTVMFVVGAMNTLWMAALTLLMLVEKVAPARWRVSQVTGVVLLVSAVALASMLVR
jgi:predicted metal-binding membrane protein